MTSKGTTMNGLEALALIRPLEFNGYQDASSSDWTKVLARFPLFLGINRRRVRKLVRKGTVIEFAAGDRVFSSEGGADFLYVILGVRPRRWASPRPERSPSATTSASWRHWPEVHGRQPSSRQRDS